ncbi:DUF1828 domain-containing protein [Neisseriaceae bacterium CLB008]
MITAEHIERILCTSFCTDIQTRERKDGWIQVSTPFVGRDGDIYNIFLKQKNGIVRVSDRGSTIMRLSYETDLKTLTGARQETLIQITDEQGVLYDDGEIYTETIASNIGSAVFKLGQALTRVSDIGLWSAGRIKSTFYEDLECTLDDILDKHNIHKDYCIPDQVNSSNYPIDYYLQGESSKPLYLFGVPDSSKARLTTIVLKQLEVWNQNFDSIVVLSKMDDIPKSDLARLMDAANDIVPSISDTASIHKKINHRLSA